MYTHTDVCHSNLQQIDKLYYDENKFIIVIIVNFLMLEFPGKRVENFLMSQ